MNVKSNAGSFEVQQTPRQKDGMDVTSSGSRDVRWVSHWSVVMCLSQETGGCLSSELVSSADRVRWYDHQCVLASFFMAPRDGSCRIASYEMFLS